MSRPKSLPQLDKDERFMAQVAWAIYVEGLTQEKVAEKLGATRLRVNKALSEAHRQGLVRISFNTPFAACTELEAGLCARFGFRQAYVAPSPMDPADTRAAVGAALGNLLSTTLADPDLRLFGMSWGATLDIAVRHVSALERPDLEVVSVMGGLTRGSDLNSYEITTHLADLLGANHSYFTAPLFANSRESRDTIMQLDVFRDVLGKLRSVQGMALSAGDMSGNSLIARHALPADVRVEDLRAMGAVGDILGYVIDDQGQPIDHPWNQRLVGIGLQDLAQIPNVILAAGGAHKLPVIRAAIKGGFVDTLVTDAKTARDLILGD